MDLTKIKIIRILRALVDVLNIKLFTPADKFKKLLSLKNKSKSQMKQDLFVLLELDFLKNGFFVEFGATNGFDLSNTYLLEKEFGWNGILAEPAKYWHENLKANRNCHIETNCVWNKSNQVLNFSEPSMKELSTISDFNFSDHHNKARKISNNYKVNTISLIDLLDKYNAPKTIDYLSIDTEGSEYEILANFNFERYKFNIITCEHNFTNIRKKIFKLLTKNGYKRKYKGLSHFDDWYVLCK